MGKPTGTGKTNPNHSNSNHRNDNHTQGDTAGNTPQPHTHYSPLDRVTLKIVSFGKQGAGVTSVISALSATKKDNSLLPGCVIKISDYEGPFNAHHNTRGIPKNSQEKRLPPPRHVLS